MKVFNSKLLSSFTALSLLAPLSSFSHAPTFTDGFYAGAKLGGRNTIAKFDHTATSHLNITLDGGEGGSDNFNEILYFPASDGRAFENNVLGNATIGYAKVIEQFFLAAELGVNLAAEQDLAWQTSESSQLIVFASSYETVTLNENLNVDVTLENPDLIFDLRPGLLLTENFLVYGRIGVAYNELSIEQEGAGNISTVDFGFPIHSSEEKDVFALRVGLGAERKLTSHLSINLDYIFTDYGDIETTFTTPSSVNIDGSSISISPDISSSAEIVAHIVTLGFNWYF